jgi:hypothetical protein
MCDQSHALWQPEKQTHFTVRGEKYLPTLQANSLEKKKQPNKQLRVLK